MSHVTQVVRGRIDFNGALICYTVIIRSPCGTIIGQVDVVDTQYDFYETHSQLQEAYRGNGLGIMLYAAAFDEALRKGIELRSSTSPSPDAVAVWRSDRLRRDYDIKKVGRRYRLLGRR